MTAARGLFAGAMRASLPLVVWAAHFAWCYVGVAIGCHAGWHEVMLAGAPALRWALAAGSAAALFAAAMLLFLAWRERYHGLLGRVRWFAALIGLIGIAWTMLPLFVLRPCQLN